MIHLLLFSFGLAASPVSSDCFGLDAQTAGSTWTYVGTRGWSGGTTASRVDSGAVEWTTTLVAIRAGPRGPLLLLRGFVTELAWSEPGTVPRLSILACRSPRIWHLEFPTDAGATEAMEHWDDSLLARAQVILEEPLRDGAVFGQNPPRADAMYGWAVEKLGFAPGLPPGCRGSSSETYRLTQRTFPDHQVVDWRAGVGITGYGYAHHGTRAEADVHLVRCSSPADARRRRERALALLFLHARDSPRSGSRARLCRVSQLAPADPVV